MQRGDSMTLTFGSWVRNPSKILLRILLKFFSEKILLRIFMRILLSQLRQHSTLCSGGNSCSAFCNHLQSGPTQPRPDGRSGSGQPKCQTLLPSPLVRSQVPRAGPGDQIFFKESQKVKIPGRDFLNSFMMRRFEQE